VQKGSPSGKPVNTLELALVGTLAIASAICLRLWFIMGDIRAALTDPNAMVLIVTEGSIKSDSARAETQLANAQSGFRATEGALAVFSVCLAMICLAMAARFWKARAEARRPLPSVSQRAKKTPA
jgi:hypothetical protein